MQKDQQLVGVQHIEISGFSKPVPFGLGQQSLENAGGREEKKAKIRPAAARQGQQILT